jgi:four helix bundle protein
MTSDTSRKRALKKELGSLLSGIGGITTFEFGIRNSEFGIIGARKGDPDLVARCPRLGLTKSEYGMSDRQSNQDVSYSPSAVLEGIVAEAQSNPVREKSFDFALEIIGLCRELQDSREYVISKQLMRSGTSIGANIEEAVSAESRRDFLHKMNLALKEARESHYWLRLLNASDIETRCDLKGRLAIADELIRLLVSITRSVSRT